MGGITTGSRLEQLYVLQRRIKHEIEALERQAALAARRLAPTASSAPKPQPRRSSGPDVVARHLVELGVTARDVKDWALEQGLITEIRRGRVGEPLIEAYASAHQR